MLLKNLNSRHPCSDQKLFLKYKCLYEGGKLFRDNIRLFIAQNPNEDYKSYMLRQQESCYSSNIGSIVDKFANQVFQAPYAVRATGIDGYQVELDPFYNDFKEDVDNMGCDLSSFFKKQFITSLVCGKSFWIAEMPDDGGIEPVDVDDWKNRGLDRARILPIEPENVLDYECDEFGDYNWVIVYSKTFARLDPRFERKFITETWKVYDRETVEVFSITYDPNGTKPKPTDDIPSRGKYPHRFSRVPILCLDMDPGMWILDRGADAQTEHFKLSCALGWSLRRVCFPEKIIKLQNKDELPTPGAAMFMGIEESVSYAEITGSGLDIVENRIKTLESQLDKLSHQMASSADSDAALGRSGLSKMTDQEATAICCRAYATYVKEAIEKTYELISDARNEFDISFSIEGMNQYSFVDATTLVNNAKIVKELGIPSETLYKELYGRVADAMLPPDLQQDIKDLIKQEINEAEIETEPEEIDPMANMNEDPAKEGMDALDES